MKLAINLPLMVSWQAFGEAFALCRNVGFDPHRLLDLFADTGGGTNALKLRAPALVSLFNAENAVAVTFDIDTARKDMQIMLDEARRNGVELPLVERTLDCFDEVKQECGGPEDTARVPVYWAARRKPG
jgi:3-hydroxyisobutyrate dehydrogenase